MEKIIIYNVADARKIITMAANMRIKSIVIDNTKLSDTLENVLAYSQITELMILCHLLIKIKA